MVIYLFLILSLWQVLRNFTNYFARAGYTTQPCHVQLILTYTTQPCHVQLILTFNIMTCGYVPAMFLYRLKSEIWVRRVRRLGESGESIHTRNHPPRPVPRLLPPLFLRGPAHTKGPHPPSLGPRPGPRGRVERGGRRHIALGLGVGAQVRARRSVVREPSWERLRLAGGSR